MIRARALCLALGLALLAPGAQATTYLVPSDYGIAAIDVATGKVLWRRPATLTRPDLQIEGAVLVAEDPAGAAKRQRLLLDPATGKPRKRRPPAGTPPVRPLTPVPINLRTAAGIALAFDAHNTRHIEAADGRVLKRIDWFPDNLTVRGDLAIFNMHDGKGGNEIYGWDLARGALAWQIDLDRHLTDLGEGAYADFAVDGDRLYASVDHRMLAFAIDGAPRLLWKTPLPQQPIREYDAPWTTFGRHGDMLFALVYEDLLALRVSDGKLLWSFDAGMLGSPWPLVHQGRVFVSYRAGEVDPSSWSMRSAGAAPPISAVEIRRVKKKWTMRPIARAAIPAQATRWSILRQPPPPRRRASPLVLTLSDSDGDAYAIDLSGAGAGPHVVTFHGFFRSAALRAGRRQIASASW